MLDPTLERLDNPMTNADYLHQVTYYAQTSDTEVVIITNHLIGVPFHAWWAFTLLITIEGFLMDDIRSTAMDGPYQTAVAAMIDLDIEPEFFDIR